MRTREVIDHFGSGLEVARRLGITHQAVYAWGDSPPMLRQYQIQKITCGKFEVQEPRSPSPRRRGR